MIFYFNRVKSEKSCRHIKFGFIPTNTTGSQPTTPSTSVSSTNSVREIPKTPSRGQITCKGEINASPN